MAAMNKAKAYKELRRRQTRKFDELLLRAQEKVMHSLGSSPATAALLGRRAESRSAGAAHAAAAAMAYVSTVLPKIDYHVSPLSPPWVRASIVPRPVTSIWRKSGVEAADNASAGAQPDANRRRIESCCEALSTISLSNITPPHEKQPPQPASPASTVSGEERVLSCRRPSEPADLRRSVSTAPRWSFEHPEGAHFDEATVVFPTASQMRQLLSLIDLKRGEASRKSLSASKKTRAQLAKQRASRCAAANLLYEGGGFLPTKLTGGGAMKERGECAHDALTGRKGAPAKQVSFVDTPPALAEEIPMPTTPPPLTLPPSPPKCVNQAAEQDQDASLVLSEKNLLLHAAALTRRQERQPLDPAAPDSRVPDDRTITWLRERQLATEQFPDILEEEEDELQ